MIRNIGSRPKLYKYDIKYKYEHKEITNRNIKIKM